MTQSKDKNKKTTSSRQARAEQPVAPVSIRLLVGVVLLSTIGLLAVSLIPIDILAIFGCVLVLLAGGVFLDIRGRKLAAAKPHPLYEPGRLPQSSPKLKIAAIVITLGFLLLTLSLTVGPNRDPRPFPFFAAAGFLYLLLPQLLARRALRLYEPDEPKSADHNGKKKKSKKSKHKKKLKK